MKNEIVLDDGTKLTVDWCGASDNILWIDGLTIKMGGAFTIFQDSNKTMRIRDPQNTEFYGYTELIHVSKNVNDTTKVALRRHT